MSVKPSAQLADWDVVRESLAQICASHGEADHFFAGVFEQIEELAAELMRRQQTWLAERREVEDDLDRRKSESEQERAALDAEREQARTEVEQSDRKMAAALSETQNELADARQEIQRQRSELENAPAEVVRVETDPQVLEQLQRSESDREDLQRQRAVLETELDSVRNRAAEMAETVAVQKGQLAEERAQWSGEFKRMRRLLETLTKRQAAQEEEETADRWSPAAVPQGAMQQVAEPVGAVAHGGDPVLGSVVAQFEMLQKDLARRRKQSPKTRNVQA